MCYDKAFATKKHIEYAQRYATTPDEIEYLQKRLDELNVQPRYFSTGFDHPDIMTIANDDPKNIQLMNWGLVPFWQNVVASNKTLNARSETVFTVASYKGPIETNRCLIITDNFFEHQHQGKTKIPHAIRMKNNEPFSIAGIWKEVTGANGEKRRTVAILTTEANPMMAKIHNNPQGSEGPRMPVILPKELERQWLEPTEDPKHTKDLVQSLCRPFDQDLMEAYTVRQLKGKNGTGNNPAALARFNYIESSGGLFSN